MSFPWNRKTDLLLEQGIRLRCNGVGFDLLNSDSGERLPYPGSGFGLDFPSADSARRWLEALKGIGWTLHTPEETMQWEINELRNHWVFGRR